MPDKDKIQQPEGSEKKPTPEQLAAQEQADLLAKLNITPEELDLAKRGSKGIAKIVQQKSETLSDKEKALEAERLKTAELNQRIEAQLAKLENHSPARARDAEEDFDSIITKYQKKVDDGTMDTETANARIKSEQKALLAELSKPKGKQDKESTEDVIRRVLKERDDESATREHQNRQQQAINSIAEKLAAQNGVSVKHAKAIYLAELDDSGDAVGAIKTATVILSKLKSSPEPAREEGVGPLTLKKRQGAENTGAAPGSRDAAITAALEASGISTG
jgi:hypothetical protein